ncbi:hypothetical protein QUU99_22635, partial [Xanthomonas citri pv. citri]
MGQMRDRPEFAFDAFDHRGDRADIGDVANQLRDLGALPAQRVRNLAQARIVAIAQRQPRTLLC